MFDHVQIKVSNLTTSKDFYHAIMNTLQYNKVFETLDVIGWGTNIHTMLEIRQSNTIYKQSYNVHITLKASSIAMVNLFYRSGLSAGGFCNGIPGYRQYQQGYYATFIIDPDGHNLEAVYQE